MVGRALRRSPSLSRAQAAIGWATFTLVLILVLFHGSNSPVFWTPMAYLIVVLFGLQLWLDLVRGTLWHAFRLQVPALLYFAALCWGFFQTIPMLPASWAHPFWAFVPEKAITVSAAPIAGQHAVLRLVAYAMVFLIAMQASRNSERALAYLKAFSLFSLALATFGLFATISGINPVLGEQATSNVSATFVNRNSYALYAAFGLVTNLGVYLHLLRSRDTVRDNRRRAWRWFIEKFFSEAWVYALGAAVCLSALLLTASRAGTAVGLIAVLALVIAFKTDRRSARAVWLSLFLVLGAFATTLSEKVLGRVLATQNDFRFRIYSEMFENLDARLFLGHGLGAFQDTFRPFVPMEAAAREWSRAHSSYLENLWEMGLPAALSFYTALAWVAFVVLRGSLIRKRNRLYPTVALSFVVIGGLHSLVDFSLQMPATAALFAFVLGIGWAHAWPSNARSAKGPTHP